MVVKQKFDKFVLATGNAGKLKEFRELFAHMGITLIDMREAGFSGEIEENGTSFRENAFIKAKTVCDAVHLPAIADDSGLSVDALDGAPGIYSARYGAPQCVTSEDRWRYLLKNLDGVEERSAAFHCYIACVFPDGEGIGASGICSGSILKEPRGKSGFGYDPIFLPDDTNCSMAELSDEEKNAISHRGKAAAAFIEILKMYADKD